MKAFMKLLMLIRDTTTTTTTNHIMQPYQKATEKVVLNYHVILKSYTTAKEQKIYVMHSSLFFWIDIPMLKAHALQGQHNASPHLS